MEPYWDLFCSRELVALSLLVCIIIPIRTFMLKHEHLLPIRVIILGGSFLIGLIVYSVAGNELSCDSLWHRKFTLTMYLPVYIFSTVYSIDTYLFLQCLPAGILIALSGGVIYTLAVGFVIGKILHDGWTLLQGVFAGFVMLPIKPTFIIMLLEHLFKHKKLGATLQLESIFTLLLSGIGCAVLYGYSTSVLTKWYHFITIVLRLTLPGLVVGYLLGRINVVLIGYMYTKPTNALTITISIMFITYIGCEMFIHSSGIMALITMATTLSLHRYRFSTKVHETLILFYGTAQLLSECIWIMRASIVVTVYALKYYTSWSIYCMSFLYLTAMIVRLIQFGVLSLILKKFSIETDVKCIVVMMMSDLKGVVNLTMVLALIDVPGSEKQFRDFSADFLGYLLLSTSINCLTLKPIIKWIGVTDVPIDRVQTMHDIILFLNSNTNDIISTFRTCRYMQNVNWNAIRNQTRLTNPYFHGTEDEKQLENYNNPRTHCTQCAPNVPYDITEKELAFYMKESRKKILRARKLTMYQLFINGQASKLVYGILLHNMNHMIESKVEVFDHIDLESYVRKKKSMELGMRLTKYLCPVDKTIPPTKPIRLCCYYLTMHIAYDFFFLALIIIYAILYEAVNSLVAIKISYALIWFFFCMDFCLKVIGLSCKELFFSGIKPYFRNRWNICDFVLLIITSWNICFMNSQLYANVLNWLVILMRLIIVVRIVLVFCPQIYHRLNRQYHRRVLLGYELATVVLHSCDEVLDDINFLLEMQMMQNFFSKDLKMERMVLVQLMEKVQRTWPWITTTVKTKKAISTILNSMGRVLHELRNSGIISQNSFLLIEKRMAAKRKMLLHLQRVPSRQGNVIFSEISWLADDLKSIDYLYENIHEVSWDAGEIVIRQGEHTPGIYVVLSGMLSLKYYTESSIAFVEGCMPIVDFLKVPRIINQFDDTLRPGDVFGVISFLTGRPYDCTIIADYVCEAYFVPSKYMEEALKMSNDPVKGLECRMWKYCMREIAATLLMDQPQYMYYTKENMIVELEHAFMPNVKDFTVFIKTENMIELLLMEGWAKDVFTDETYAGPVVFPNTINRIQLISRKIKDVIVYPRLLIVHKPDVKPHVIMEAVETAVNDEKEDYTFNKTVSYIYNDLVNTHDDLGYRRRYNILTRASEISVQDFRFGKDKAIVVLESEETLSLPHTYESIEDNLELMQMNTRLVASDMELKNALKRSPGKRISEMSELEEL